MNQWMTTSPVVIGGMGGSGTRAVAALLMKMGYFLGTDLNEALDNLWFTFLFKRPRRFNAWKENEKEIWTGLAILEKAMKRRGGYSWREYSFLLRAAFEMARFGHDQQGSGRGLWALVRFKRILYRTPATILKEYAGWGWKEPNSHLFIESLNRYFGDLKYIHVIRHGLDMAYSGNQAQLLNWGKYFGIGKPRTPEEIATASLEYWIKTNQRAIYLGETLLKDRFLLVNFDNLCLDPKDEINKILEFLKINSLSGEHWEELYALAGKPEYVGRYKKKDISKFPEDKLNEVRKLGFHVETEKIL